MPTPYDARYVGRDVTILEFGTTDVIATYRRADIRVSVETVDVSAVSDSGRRHRPIKYSYTITFEGVKSVSSTWLADQVSNNFGNLAWQMQEATDGHTYSGYVTFQDIANPFADEAQVDQITFQGTGDLYVDGSAIQILPLIS